MNIVLKSRLAAAVLALTTCAGAVLAQSPSGGPSEVIHHRSNPFEAGAPTAGSTGTQSPNITFHGGPLMATPTVYLIWYGNWSQSNNSDTAAGQTIVRDFLHGLGGSPYYLINSSYGTPTGNITVGAEYTDPYSQTARLSDSRIQAIVSHAISGGHLPTDSNGIYAVLTSSDVSESSGFCSRYCGWHTAGTIAGTTIKYAFIGNANRCLSACAAQTTGPNGNAGVDGMISVLAHELEETTTDPLPTSGWADSGGAENGDKCAWTFGSHLSVASNGAFYNMTLPGASVPSRNFLVQRNLDASSRCYVNYVTRTQ